MSRTFARAAFYLALAGILVLAVLPDLSRLPEVTRINDKLNHIAAFVVLGLLGWLAYPRASSLRLGLGLLGFGLLIEAVQAFIPYREASVFDLTADGVALLLVLGPRELLARRQGTQQGTRG